MHLEQEERYREEEGLEKRTSICRVATLCHAGPTRERCSVYTCSSNGEAVLCSCAAMLMPKE